MFDEEFYPTSMSIASAMTNRVSKEARYFLEPSAGKGDIAERIRGDSEYRRYNHHRTVDCIEQSPELVSVLTGKDFPVVGFDWLTYDGVCYYDAIVMNPPFSNGDEHLLKAWDFLRSGEIVCLLNAETINNPHTARRQRLAEIIEQHGDVESLGDCFVQSERKTGVEVAMVYLRKVAADDAADLWKSDAPEKDIGLGDVTPDNMLAIQDKLSNMQHYYDKANEHMLEAFRHIRKAATYMSGNKIDGHDYENIIKLAFRDFNEARAEYFKKHRRDAWMAVFNQMEFRKWLDKVQTDAFVRDIERNGNIPFTKDNIRGTLENVFLQRRKLFEKSCANVFDELRKYHADNVHHTLTIVANLAAWRKVGRDSSSSAATWRKCPHSSTSRRNAHCSPSATFSTACHYPATFAQARCTESLPCNGRRGCGWRSLKPGATGAALGTTLLLAATGQTFMLSSMDIWVRQIGVALSVQQPTEAV